MKFFSNGSANQLWAPSSRRNLERDAVWGKLALCIRRQQTYPDLVAHRYASYRYADAEVLLLLTTTVLMIGQSFIYQQTYKQYVTLSACRKKIPTTIGSAKC